MYVFNLTLFASDFSYIFLRISRSGSAFGIQVRIRIHKGPEYGSILDLDPDPQHWMPRPSPLLQNFPLCGGRWPPPLPRPVLPPTIGTCFKCFRTRSSDVGKKLKETIFPKKFLTVLRAFHCCDYFTEIDEIKPIFCPFLN